MAKRRLTSGRRRPWACGHRGFGATCNRCAQANELETRANALAQFIKTKAKDLPSFVEVQNDRFVVRAGGVHISCVTHNNTQEAALTQGVAQMREHASRLLEREHGL